MLVMKTCSYSLVAAAVTASSGIMIAAETRFTPKPAQVLETTVTRQGGRDIIVQRLALDPNIPVKPVVPAKPLPAPPKLASPTVFAPPSYLLLLFATVCPGPNTYLR
jgi:hypothetical protein